MPRKDRKSALPCLEDFLLYIQANNYSKETLYNYERDLETFELFLGQEMDSLPFSDITKRTIEQFKAYLNSSDRKTAKGAIAKQDLSSGSINRTLTSLRRYLAYLIDMDQPAPVAPGSIKLLRMEKKHPQISELAE
ncbi:MAG: site-specific integrase, partial [Dehalococcoidales bacterium]|nr:site-specific integrase [Dehalococcoidales bacterium]